MVAASIVVFVFEVVRFVLARSPVRSRSASTWCSGTVMGQFLSGDGGQAHGTGDKRPQLCGDLGGSRARSSGERDRDQGGGAAAHGRSQQFRLAAGGKLAAALGVGDIACAQGNEACPPAGVARGDN